MYPGEFPSFFQGVGWITPGRNKKGDYIRNCHDRVSTGIVGMISKPATKILPKLRKHPQVKPLQGFGVVGLYKHSPRHLPRLCKGGHVEVQRDVVLPAPVDDVLGGYVTYQFILGHRATAYAFDGAVEPKAA